MTARAEFQRILEERLSYSALWIAVGGLALTSLLFSFVAPLLSPNKMPKLPIALQAEIPNEKERIERYLSDTQHLLITGYNKVRISQQTLDCG